MDIYFSFRRILRDLRTRELCHADLSGMDSVGAKKEEK